MSDCSNIILVSGLPNDVSKIDLQIYFQSRIKSSGGEIARIQIDRQRGEAEIEFVDASVAKRVLARDHEYQGCPLTVVEYTPFRDEFESHETCEGADHEKCTSILVSGLSSASTEDSIQMYFENPKSDGGEVTDVTKINGNNAIVTFTSSGVVKRVLGRRHEYQGCQLTVTEYKPHETSYQEEPECISVLVSGLSSASTEDSIQMYFENPKSGGGEVTNVKHRGNKAIVTFASQDAAKRVVARSHEYQGCQLKVEEYKPFKDEDAADTTVRCTSILVSGLSSASTEDSIQMYFENRKSGGGEVTNVTKINVNKAIVTFTSPDVVKRVLGRRHEYQGCKLTVTEYKPHETSYQEEPECTSVLVSGLSSAITEDSIQMYFENPKSGGGKVTNVKIHGNKAVVTFASPDDAKRVLTKKHEYQGCQLTVKEYEQSRECCTVLVSGLSSAGTEDSIQMYFENPKSDGGEVTDVTKINGNKAIVTFTSPDVANRVVAREHFYQGCHLKVEKYEALTDEAEHEELYKEKPKCASVPVSCISSTPTVSKMRGNVRHGPPSGIDNTANVKVDGNKSTAFISSEKRIYLKKSFKDDDANPLPLKETPKEISRRLHVMNIRNGTTSHDFELFMKWASEDDVESIVFGSNSNAMVTFKHPPDVDKVQENCRRKELKGRFLNISQLNIDCIEVSGLPSDSSISKDNLFFHFDNPMNGGGKVKNVELDSETTPRKALIFFEDPSVVNNVTRQEDHTIKGTKLKVVPYSSLLGEIVTSPGGERKERVVKLDPQIMVFIYKFHPEEFDQLLQDNSVYTKQQGSGKIIIVATEQNMDKTTWETCCDAIESYINQIVVDKITVSRDAWKEMCDIAQTKCDHNQVDLVRKESESSFTLTGKKYTVSVLAETLRSLSREMEKPLKLEKNKITETISLPDAQFELLRFTGFVEEVQIECENLEVAMSINDLTITLTGPEEAVKEVSKTVSNNLKESNETELELPKCIVDVVGSQPGKVFVASKFKKVHIDAVVNLDPNNVTQLLVTAVDRRDMKKAVDLIKDLTSEQSVPLDADQKQLLHTEKWKELKHSIHQSLLLVRVTEEPASSTLWIAGIREEVEKAKNNVKEFFEENIFYTEMIEAENGRVKFIFKHQLNEVKIIEDSLRSQRVRISERKESDGVNGVLISGTKEGIEEAVPKAVRLISDVKERRLNLETKGLFSGSNEILLLSGVENEHNCVIERCTASHGTKPSLLRDLDENKSLSKMICSYVTPEGKKIILYKGDLTEHKVDVMLNPADGSLKHDKGVAKVIVAKGGQEVQDECDAFISKNPPLSYGEVLVTGAGKLPCEKLVHVVVPNWRSSGYDKEHKTRMLSQVVLQSLEKTAEKYTSIALPALSAGILGCPLDVCAKTLIDSVLEFSEESPNSKLTDIHFVDINDSVVGAFHGEMKARFGEEPSFATGGAKARFGSKGKGGRRNPVTDPNGDPHLFTTAQGMKIIIDIKDLAKMKTHAIVNTVSTDLDLTKNPCAKAISIGAGPNLQEKCKAKGSLSVGEMLVTDGYNLECIKIFHVVVGDWKKGQGESALRSLIQSCLKEAHSNTFSSIAFPAIGTGNLNYPKDAVAKAFFEEADTFKGKNPQSSLDEVHLVLYHKDKPTIKAFEEELKKRLKCITGKPRRRRLFYKGIPNEDISSSPSMGPIRLEILSGSITEQTTDAIVIPSTPSVKLSQTGEVGIAVANAGGSSIQDECDQLAPQKPGSVLCTSAGRLQTKKIFHLVFGDSYPVSRLKEIMIKCFREADSLKINSIAVPAIGTGRGNMSPRDAAKALLSGIAKFALENPTSINHIRVVVYQDHMLKDFEKAIEDLKELSWCASMWKGFKAGLKMVFGIGGSEEAAYAKLPKSTTKLAKAAISSSLKEETLSLQIFAANRNDLDKAEAKINELVKEKKGLQEIYNDAIEKLSESKIERIREVERKLNDINIQIDKKMKRILIRGHSGNLSIAYFEISQILNKNYQEEQFRKYAELLSMSIQWYYIDGGVQEPYDIEINAKIEQAYKDKKPSVLFLAVDDDDDDDSDDDEKPTQYVQIHFDSKTETNLKTGDTTRVERKDKNIQLPSHWNPQSKDHTGKELVVDLVELDSNSKEYSDVKKAIEKTSTINIIKIERVQNPTLYRAYMVKKQQMDDKLKNGSNEKKLFHGTSFDASKIINFRGFDRSFCGTKNAKVFGRGVYFARDALYSMQPKYSTADPTGKRYLYMVSVLVGEYTKGEEVMITPPPKDLRNSTIAYDSVVNDVSNPTIYVVFHDTQNYPDYLITFK